MSEKFSSGTKNSKHTNKQYIFERYIYIKKLPFMILKKKEFHNPIIHNKNTHLKFKLHESVLTIDLRNILQSLTRGRCTLHSNTSVNILITRI